MSQPQVQDTSPPATLQQVQRYMQLLQHSHLFQQTNTLLYNRLYGIPQQPWMSTMPVCQAQQAQRHEQHQQLQMQTTQGLSKTGAGSADIEAGNEADNEADKKTKKKRKYNTSKNNPRRPLTAYTCFVAKERSTMKNAKPNAAFKIIARITGERWRALSEEDRKPYKLMALKDIERFKLEKQIQMDREYQEKTNTDSQRDPIAFAFLGADDTAAIHAQYARTYAAAGSRDSADAMLALNATPSTRINAEAADEAECSAKRAQLEQDHLKAVQAAAAMRHTIPPAVPMAGAIVVASAAAAAAAVGIGSVRGPATH